MISINWSILNNVSLLLLLVKQIKSEEKMMVNNNDMSNKDSVILVLIIVSNSASSQYDDINTAASKMTKATINVTTNGSSTNQARSHIQSNPPNSTNAAISASRYDRRH